MVTTTVGNSPIGSQQAIALEDKYGAHNYAPLPVVISRGEGVYVWDAEGKRYYDFLSAYSSLNQGHCHPRLVDTMIDQAQKITLTSRAFYNDQLGVAEKYIAELFGYDKVLMMNSGAEAVETAIKLARRWGYVKKGIPENDAVVVTASGNFHGRTTTIVSFSNDPDSSDKFGPYTPGFTTTQYNDVEDLENVLQHRNVCAFLLEPIQGEAGVVVPDDDYLRKVAQLCSKYNVLLIDDEIQTGIGRTGKMLAMDHVGIRPDLITMGKAISGGMMPISCVLADDDVMLTIKPGEHGSTFGGNPLAARLAVEALQIIQDERLAENAVVMGELFRKRMNAIDSPVIELVRGRGLLNAVVINEEAAGFSAAELCKRLLKNGLLAKYTHGNIIRFAPPLIITEEQMNDCCDIIEQTIKAI